ncbi:Cof-type HAD-IIB family hydrolase [Cetobacterium somerae]|uniref:Cof-type HAD-IIB family hydrolase n=1 Tax=Cetobacterium sp. NK01 TaxID=2993530 RepID=UPI00211703A0|nr:Cof-type HAD-IIB family hydrolase [Cetobacterium sp. NK01]MCQ8211873.1 Cof-type HAD-IIB family hydrolase [Cetobacterium sp. NK01]
MKYKMIVTDLDDTLLNSQGKVSLKDKESILKAQEEGIIFVLASGRPTYAMRDLAKELKLDKYGSYILSYNGSIITNCKTNKNILEETLTKDEIHQLYDFSKKNNVEIITYLDDTIVSENYSSYIEVEVELTKMPFEKVKNFKATIDKDCVKCILLEEPSYLKKVEEKLKNELGKNFSIAISKPFFLEVTKLGVDKGSSLLKLAKKLNIRQEEIIVVGDSYNDLPMLKIAGLPACVENAKPEIKEICKFISTSNNNNGMTNIIENLILKK